MTIEKENTMTARKIFLDPKLPPAVASLMQATYDRRASQGLLSADGKSHKTAEAKALYDGGASPFSEAYFDATYPELKE